MKINLPKLSESIIRAAATPSSFERGQEYYKSGALSNTAIQENVLTGDCEGTQAPFYHIQVELDEAGIRAAHCTCPYDYAGSCKHTVALLLTYLHHPKQFTARQAPADLLADLDRDDLLALMARLLRDKPELYDWVAVAIAAPAESGKSKRTRHKPVDADVYRRQISGILHSLDGLRASEAYGQVGGLTGELLQVQETSRQFLDAGNPETALAILMTLVEEAGHGIEYIDDSDGYLGGFVNGLGQPLAEAILMLDMSAVEHDKLARQLEKLSAYLGDYGIEDGLDVAIQAATLGWEEAEPDAQVFGDLTGPKLNVLKRQGRSDEYLALSKKTGRHLDYALMLCDLERVPEAIAHAERHLAAADEALQVAERLRASGHIAQAISIGERGLKLSGAKVHLGEWLGPIEEAQGRTEQALRAWLAAFPEHPTLPTYETLKRLAGETWRELQPRVMETLRKSHEAMTLAQVIHSEQERDEAIKVAERREVWYGVIETVADAVTPHRPEWVAQMSIKQAERLMAEAQSKNYPFAANWLKRAKKAYTQMGQTREWQIYLQQVKEQYKRRPALQAQLQRL